MYYNFAGSAKLFYHYKLSSYARHRRFKVSRPMAAGKRKRAVSDQCEQEARTRFYLSKTQREVRFFPASSGPLVRLFDSLPIIG